MKLKKDRVVIANDVSTRNGIGVEIYKNDKLKVEIFRDDTEKTHTISVFEDDKFIAIPLSLMEEAIKIFKKDIPWSFIDHTKIENSEE